LDNDHILKQFFVFNLGEFSTDEQVKDIFDSIETNNDPDDEPTM